MMSSVTVMMWQPISSAWKMLSSSRGLAQISSVAAGPAQRAPLRHHRHRVAAGIGNAPGKDGNEGRRVLAEGSGNIPTCAGHHRGDVELDAVMGKPVDERAADSRRVFVTGILT